MLTNKCIVLGVTGGIAAFKAAELVSALSKVGADVHVIMTKSAQQFVTPLTFQTLSRNLVVTDMFALTGNWQVEHISLADKADLFLVAPATANFIGKVAGGIADDMLTTTIMATRAPVVVAPAMNVHMYENQTVQKNIDYLKGQGYIFIEPEEGPLACGYTGKGRLAQISTILQRVKDIFNTSDALAGKKVLVTAGPTREAIDPVRYISNRSTGKMGYAIAEEALRRGAEVTLISGPTNLTPPIGANLVPVESAEEMYSAVKSNYKNAQIIIKSAAVADYRPKQKSSRKIKKTTNDMILELEKNPDILQALGAKKGEKILVGFAAETDNLIKNAKDKISRKNLDFIVANDITREGAGFGTETNIVKIINALGKTESLPKMSKKEVARVILDRIEDIIKNR